MQTGWKGVKKLPLCLADELERNLLACLQHCFNFHFFSSGTKQQRCVQVIPRDIKHGKEPMKKFLHLVSQRTDLAGFLFLKDFDSSRSMHWWIYVRFWQVASRQDWVLFSVIGEHSSDSILIYIYTCLILKKIFLCKTYIATFLSGLWSMAAFHLSSMRQPKAFRLWMFSTWNLT